MCPGVKEADILGFNLRSYRLTLVATVNLSCTLLALTTLVSVDLLIRLTSLSGG